MGLPDIDWMEKLVDLGFGGLPTAVAALCPSTLKAQWRDRIATHHPLRSISANHDLVRATRLAWTSAAHILLVDLRRELNTPDRRREAERFGPVDHAIGKALGAVRAEALDPDKVPASCPIDRHVQAIIFGVSEQIAPGAHGVLGTELTADVTVVLAELAGCSPAAIPHDLGHLAQAGLPVDGGAPRPFGELVFAAFAELIKSPTAYPEAREAFHIAMDRLARDLAEATLNAVRGIDARLDAQIAALDALTVFRTGAERYLALLPRIAEDTAATRQSVERMEDRLETMPSQIVADLLAALDRRGEAKAAEQAGVQRQAVIALARRISADVDDFDRALRELERAVAIAVDVGAEAARAGNLDAFVVQVLERVAVLSNAGRFDDAAAEAERAIARWEREEREEEERRQRRRADGLALLDAGIRQDLLRRDARAAAAKIARQVELDAPDRAGLFRRLRAVQDEWFVRGRDLGLNLDLEVSIELARITFEVAGDADERGAALNDLGVALTVLGERESGTERLEQAIAAYRAALEEWTRERVPLQWAMTQNNLGTALQALGEREAGTERLVQAVAAYQAALEEHTRKRVPLDWAMTQNNLGNALQTIGKRETGTERLVQAVAAYRAALKERTRERVPLDWAMTKNNLGAALQILGTRQGNLTRLEEAIGAYSDALKEYTRERVPLDWAMVQNNLGNALRSLGERKTGTERLEQAVVAYRAALEEWTRDRVPLEWAIGTGGQGVTLMALADRIGDAAMAADALSQIEAAYALLCDAGHPLADTYASLLPDARALVERLGPRPSAD